MEEKLEQLLEATRPTVIKALIRDWWIWDEKPLSEYTCVDGGNPKDFDALVFDLVTREVERLSAEFQRYLGLPEDEYNDDIYRTEADFLYSVYNELYKTDFHSKCV